ncbi:putative DNA maturase A [Proteus phage PM16]|uniref:DNA maturase A n=3 Tax=Novosibovirus TaxID=2732939 RepID=A0A514CYA1_9CAUD|nr:terminase small subunit [Proteus phage PM16]AGZ17283.1 putative DNA maturase A [Proteus phage PM16]QDH85501.1 DNA maturase A [Proteus phage vB_PmiP_RS8pmA]UGC97839.1 terminase small subunit [Proteus phage 309]
MSKAATKSRLADLHRKFTEALINELKEAEEGEYPLAAADKSVIAKFLKDNEITASADEGEMLELKDEFEAELERKRKEKANVILEQLGEDSGSNLDFLM